MTGSYGPGSETRGLKRIEKIRKIGDITDQSGGNLSRNPPKGIKRSRRLPKENDTPKHFPDPVDIFKE